MAGTTRHVHVCLLTQSNGGGLALVTRHGRGLALVTRHGGRFGRPAFSVDPQYMSVETTPHGVCFVAMRAAIRPLSIMDVEMIRQLVRERELVITYVTLMGLEISPQHILVVAGGNNMPLHHRVTRKLQITLLTNKS